MQAAIVAGNIQQESGFNPKAYNPKEDAFGGIQWRLDRLDGLRNLARQRGVDPSDIPTQVAWMIAEGKGPEAKSWNAFMAARTPEDANAALRGFIRYGDDSQGTRLNYARAFLGQAADPTITAPVASPSPSAAAAIASAPAAAQGIAAIPAATGGLESLVGTQGQASPLMSLLPFLQGQQTATPPPPLPPIRRREIDPDLVANTSHTPDWYRKRSNGGHRRNS